MCCRRAALVTASNRPPCAIKAPFNHLVVKGSRAGFGTLSSHRAEMPDTWARSEEHTSELQSRRDLVCRLLLEKKKKKKKTQFYITQHHLSQDYSTLNTRATLDYA